jgi:hypothetical protein
MSESSLLLERSTDRTREFPLTPSDRVSVIAEDRDISIYELLGHAIELVHHDRAWLAIQRVADALEDRGILISTDVDRLVGKRANGAGNW